MYQSEIHVELIEDCSDKLVRIYEMIHRNNQLNFTKDRISQEEVDRIFTDSEITSGVVHVTDKYGDHGIIGCYAIKDGKALQLVFSCRILGMGVEQWVYAELGYPDIEVVGEVATELNKTDKPEWINQSSITFKSNAGADQKSFITMIIYGTCAIRPVYAYLQPCLPNIKFANIDPLPCPLNLAVALRAADEQKQEWMKRVSTINNIYTFDKDIYSEKTNYVLFTLQNMDRIKKYVSKYNGQYFYSVSIKATDTDESFFEEYTSTPVSTDDIEEELSFICEHLSANTVLLIQTLPEVEFPQKGKDYVYTLCKEHNELVEKIASKYKNVHLIDIRKYAKSPTDFADSAPNHYNRNIGFYLAEEILNFVGVKSTGRTDKQTDTIPDNAVVQKFTIRGTDDSCNIITNIINGQFITEIQFDCPEKYMVKLLVIRNRLNEFISDITDQKQFKVNVLRLGCWRAKAVVYDATTKKQICEFSTSPINYTKYNYFKYLEDTSYINATAEIEELINRNIHADTVYTTIVNQISELSAVECNPFDFFTKQGIDEINIFIDERVGKIIMPFIKRSNVKVRYVFTTDNVNLFGLETEYYNINDINNPLPLGEKDVVLYAFDYDNFKNIHKLFSGTNAKIYTITYVLSCMLTKYLFVDRFKNKIPKIITVRTANLRRNEAFDYSKLTSNEKNLDDNNFINETDVIKRITNGYELLPPQLRRIPKDELIKLMKVPHTIFDNKVHYKRFADMAEEHMNIQNGIRKTAGNPESYIGTIYIFGGPHALGYGVKDEETIASYLQNILQLPYRVQNYANCWGYDYTHALNLMDKIDFSSNDIAVFIMANWMTDIFDYQYYHWLCWEAIEDPIIKVDAFPLFEKRDRPDYFLHRYGYTPECNLELAKLIRDVIYKNIKLFDIE